MDGLYSIAAVARRTGLQPDTIRAWERRHRLIEPRRAPSGVRSYSEKDILRLELTRDATRLGHAIRHVAALPNADLRRLVQAQTFSPTSPELEDSVGAVISQTLQAIKKYDLAGAQRSLTAAAMVLSNDDFALRVLAPLLRRVGAAWSAGNFEIAQEHLVSQLVGNLAGSLALQNSAADTAAGLLVFATPPGELHEFGIALAALIAGRSGFATVNLGPSLPAEDLGRAARQMHARTIVLGSMASGDDLAVPAFLRTLSQSVAAKTEVWVGGPNAAVLCKKSGLRRIQAISTLETFADRIRTASGDGNRRRA